MRSATHRLVLAGSLVTAMAIAPLVQFGLAALAPFLITDLGITRTQVGLLTSAVFVTAGVSAPWLGSLADRFGTRPSLLAIYAAGGVVAGMLYGAGGYLWVLLAAVVTGAPMAMANPVTNLLVRDQLLPGQRGLLMGLKQAAVQMAAATAGFALPWAAGAWGWRPAMLLIMAPVALGALLTLLVPTPSVVRGAPVAGDAGPRHDDALVRWVTGYAVFMGAAQAAVQTYLPLYGFEEAGLRPELAGGLAGVMGTVGVVSRLAWGRAAERAASVSGPLRLISLGAFASVLLILAGGVLGAPLLVAAAIGFGATAPVWNVVAMLAILREVPDGATGRATGVLYAGFSAGFIFGPLLFGLTTDAVGSYMPGWAGVAALCAVAGVLAHRRRRSLCPTGPTARLMA